MFFDQQVVPTLPRLISPHKNALRRAGMQSHFFNAAVQRPENGDLPDSTIFLLLLKILFLFYFQLFLIDFNDMGYL